MDNNSQTNNIESEITEIKSPIFKSAPGWGGKLKIWGKKHFYSVILPTGALVILLFSMNLFSQKVMEGQTFQEGVIQTEGIIEKTAGTGQGITHIVREALTDYLNEHPEISLLPQQKIFIETNISNNFKNKQVAAGEKIDFKKDDIAKTIEEAENLTPEQLTAWSKYLPKQEL